jgi:hypothetical protein
MVSITVVLIVESGVVIWFPKTAKKNAHYSSTYSAWRVVREKSTWHIKICMVSINLPYADSFAACAP